MSELDKKDLDHAKGAKREITAEAHAEETRAHRGQDPKTGAGKKPKPEPAGVPVTRLIRVKIEGTGRLDDADSDELCAALETAGEELRPDADVGGVHVGYSPGMALVSISGPPKARVNRRDCTTALKAAALGVLGEEADLKVTVV